ncbi:MAG: FAD:protein FMN transferase [Planctomycetes bacterium]|nr:FAD:protein FMN transferase [Planctomycetota bacterium]
MGLVLGLCFIGTLFAVPPSAEPSLSRFDFREIHMGVPFRIVLYAPNESSANKAARAAFDRIAQLNRIMSDYDQKSELMRLCKSARPEHPVKVSPELLFVLSRSNELSRKTKGAFDVSVGPVVRLWRRARRRKQLPDPIRLGEARRLVDYRFIEIDEKAGTVTLQKTGMRLDLGGIAKGYAGDQALDVLKQRGITQAMIDGSGDIVVGDPPPGKRGWKIGIAPLEKPDGPPSRYLLLSNAAIATSGDAFQYVEIAGIRYSHIVNPKTGLGLTTRSSVTVIAPDGITADSLASAVAVLGVKKGLNLIEATNKTAALFVQIKNGKRQESSSRRLNDYVLDERK